MTHTIEHQYDEILQGAWPGLEIHVVYYCTSEIVIDDEGEHDPFLLTIRAEVNGAQVVAPPFPLEEHGSDAKKFLAILRESARQTLWAKALKVAREHATEWDSITEFAERWMRTGSTKMPMPFPIDKPKKNFVI